MAWSKKVPSEEFDGIIISEHAFSIFDIVFTEECKNIKSMNIIFQVDSDPFKSSWKLIFLSLNCLNILGFVYWSILIDLDLVKIKHVSNWLVIPELMLLGQSNSLFHHFDLENVTLCCLSSFEASLHFVDVCSPLFLNPFSSCCGVFWYSNTVNDKWFGSFCSLDFFLFSSLFGLFLHFHNFMSNDTTK